MITRTANTIRENLKNSLKNKLISLKFDSATKFCKHFLSVNLQFCHENVIFLYHLETFEMSETSTGENLKNIILVLLQKYEISYQQIVTITVDNGANMISCIKKLNQDDLENTSGTNSSEHEEEMNFNYNLSNNNDSRTFIDKIKFFEKKTEEVVEVIKKTVSSKIKTVRCAAHTFQLSIRDFLNKKGVNVLNNSRKINKRLRNIVYYNELKLQKSLPISDNDTRWFSSYLMLKSFLKNKKFIEEKAVNDYLLFIEKIEWQRLFT